MGYNDVNSVCPFLMARVYLAGRERTKEMIISPKYDDMMKELFHNETVLRYFLSDILRVCPDRIWNLRLKSSFLAATKSAFNSSTDLFLNSSINCLLFTARTSF